MHSLLSSIASFFTGETTPRYKLYRPSNTCEAIVSDYLYKNLPEGYYIFNDLLLPTTNNVKTAQIDHVVISQYGVFCIETKSHHGNIYGYKGQRFWSQYLAKQRYPLLNPMIQNTHHVNALNYSLGNLLKQPVKQLVTFPNARKVMIDKELKDASLYATLSNIVKHQEVIYSEHDVALICRRLSVATKYRESLRPVHITNIQNYHSTTVLSR